MIDKSIKIIDYDIFSRLSITERPIAAAYFLSPVVPRSVGSLCDRLFISIRLGHRITGSRSEGSRNRCRDHRAFRPFDK